MVTQPYDLVVESLIDQIKGGTIFLHPISERPSFQRRYVWSNQLASRLIESILLNVPIPPCYLSQNEDFELDVIEGQQRLYSIYRFFDNQFPLSGLEVLKDFIGNRFHELPPIIQRQLKTHTLRLVAVTNEISPRNQIRRFSKTKHKHHSVECSRIAKLCLSRHFKRSPKRRGKLWAVATNTKKENSGQKNAR